MMSQAGKNDVKVNDLSRVRLLLGVLTGLLLWLIWQVSAITSPDAESAHYERFLSNLPPGWMDFFRPWTREDFIAMFRIAPPNLGSWWTFGKELSTDAAIVHTWIGFMPLACLFAVLFSVLKPLPRFVLWAFSLLLVGGIVFYCFQSFQYFLPLSPPIILLSSFYVCGTVIFLETEKIERNRSFAIDLQMQAEFERKRIAKDLHDESLQALSRLIRIVDKLGEEIPENDVPRDVRSRLESCIAGTRRIINDLHPACLEEFGLSASLEQLIEDLQVATGMKTRFQDSSNGSRLSDFYELCIFRIAQEAINNVERHSAATELSVTLKSDERFLTLSIADNGKGVVRKKQGSLGLQNMSDRAKLMGGSVEWTAPTEYSSGTMVALRIPSQRLEYRSRNQPDQGLDR